MVDSSSHIVDTQSLDCPILCPCTGEEMAQLETLEGQWRAALDKSKHKKKQVKQLQDELQVVQSDGT